MFPILLPRFAETGEGEGQRRNIDVQILGLVLLNPAYADLYRTAYPRGNHQVRVFADPFDYFA